jgi:hypothetical protein
MLVHSHNKGFGQIYSCCCCCYRHHHYHYHGLLLSIVTYQSQSLIDYMVVEHAGSSSTTAVVYRMSEKSGTNGNFSYFSYFCLQVKVRGYKAKNGINIG